jgi:iron complex outermembrane recepter protein
MGQPNPGDCALISRDPVTGRIIMISDINQNVGKLETAGIDFGMHSRMQTSVGEFDVAIDTTWLDSFDRTQDVGMQRLTIHGAGTYDLGALPRFKASVATNWLHEDWEAGLDVRYAGGFIECANPADNSSAGGLCYVQSHASSRDVGSNIVVDLHASYTFSGGLPGKTSIALGINNALGEAPQYVYSAALANSDPSLYDYVGRFVYARIKETF